MTYGTHKKPLKCGKVSRKMLNARIHKCSKAGCPQPLLKIKTKWSTQLFSGWLEVDTRHTIKWLLQCLAEWAEVIKADGNRLANGFYYLANGRSSLSSSRKPNTSAVSHNFLLSFSLLTKVLDCQGQGCIPSVTLTLNVDPSLSHTLSL